MFARRWLPIAATAAFALALALVLAPWAPAGAASPAAQDTDRPLDQLAGDDFDRAFLAQMTMHHAMAVMMARPVVANGAHEELRGMASQIIADQTREIAQMRAWAREWYGLDLPDHLGMMDAMQQGAMPGNGMPMGGQPGHEGHHGAGAGRAGMPMGQPGQGMMGQGMMGQGQGMMGHMGEMSMMADLWKLPPNRLDAVFMSLMIPHHQGAIDMATLALERAAHQEIKDMAAEVIRTQDDENARMNGWLAAWYGL